MQTLKIKYKTNNEIESLIKEYQRQYSCVLRFAYNRIKDNVSQKDIEYSIKSLNNINLMECFFIRSSVKESVQINKTNKNKLIFGGKKNFIQRCQNKITKTKYKNKRLSPLYSMGEANQKGNRKFSILSDTSGFLFKPNKSTHIELIIDGGYKRYKKILNKLFELQELKEIPISYKLDSEYIYISFDESIFKQKQTKQIKNRIFSIDLNPNYVGWSIVDWKSSSDFSVIKSGVISTKQINDKDFSLKGKGCSSESKQRIYLNNKRTTEVFEISKYLINIAKHYQCSLFVMEDLSIKSSDKSKGKGFNKLCNNLWNRDKLVNNLIKRCNLNNIQLLKVLPNYSSFIGNFLFRDLKLPDMILSSIEISRRGYEFNSQYIIKEKEIKKNIIQPSINDFADRFVKSMEEFNISGDFKDLIELYYFLKKSKCRYRLSLDDLNLKFSRCFSPKSLLMKLA